ncbi:MAG: hypothetical protein V3S14_12295 [Anaerolineae bacterium]
MMDTDQAHSHQIPANEEQKDRAQSNPRTTRKWTRMYYVLTVTGMLVVYVAGLYSHPLLFGASTAASAEDCATQTEAVVAASDESARPSQVNSAKVCPSEAVVLPANGESAQMLGLQDISIAQAYQMLAQEVRNLNNGDYATSELEDRLAAIEQEVEQLRVLNPYYLFKEIQAEVIPNGVPDTYGAALNVSFDQVQASINVMRKFDPTYGEDGIVLTGADLEQYVRVGSATACLYCCDARTLVKPDGVAACGCAHSQAMRGLGAYLITNYPGDYTDEELVEELNRWRAVYFPKQTLTQALVERRDAGEPGIEEIESEFPEFMPQMVGGC